MKESRFCGWSDPPLNAAGRAQCLELPSKLDLQQFDSVWSSDLRRCVQTAEIAGIAAVPDRRLRELNFGAIEMHRWDDLDAATQHALVAFETFAAPGGESTIEMRSRVLDFCEQLPFGRHLVITHGGVIRLLCRSTNTSSIDPVEPIQLDL